MAGVTYGLADFVTRQPILDLPVKKGASWTAQLNRADELSCKVDMRSREVKALDLPSATEPHKTILYARNDDDVVLAWGLIGDDREWDEDARELSLTAKGVWSSYFGRCIIGPAAALTEPLVLADGKVNPALDTKLSGLSLGSIGKRLVQQRLAWPGAPTFILPADEAVADDGDHRRDYAFSSFKTIGAALTDLTQVENGPDFAFEMRRSAADGLSFEYVMRHGTETRPRLGVDVGSWPLGGQSPISKLTNPVSASDMATTSWASAGRASGGVLLARAHNETMIANGYPPSDYVDTSHNDVTRQSTLDAYARAGRTYASKPVNDLPFTVRGDATPGLGEYRPGDVVVIDVPEGHPWFGGDMVVRVTSVGGDETGKSLKIGCEVLV